MCSSWVTRSEAKILTVIGGQLHRGREMINWNMSSEYSTISYVIVFSLSPDDFVVRLELKILKGILFEFILVH